MANAQRRSSGQSQATTTGMPKRAIVEVLEFAQKLIATFGTDKFEGSIVDELGQLTPFDYFSWFYLHHDRPPIFVLHNLTGGASPEALESYTAGTYLLDPVYTACRRGITGFHRLRDLAPDAYFENHFRSSVDMFPCISTDSGAHEDEIVYIFNVETGTSYVLSLMRRKDRRAFDERDVSLLKALEPILTETVRKHWLQTAHLHPQRTALDDSEPQHELEKGFSSFASDVLSSREQMVVSLLLRGHSTLSIAQNLNIAEGTAKIHRKHIYEKLGISSQAQLYLQFCQHILEQRNSATAVS